MVLGSGRNNTPACTGATFSVFQAVRNTVFYGIAFEGARGDDLFDFVAYFGLCWGTRRLHFGHHWALISRTDFEEILGAKVIDFWDPPPTGKMVPARAAGLLPSAGSQVTSSSWSRSASVPCEARHRIRTHKGPMSNKVHLCSIKDH